MHPFLNAAKSHLNLAESQNSAPGPSSMPKTRKEYVFLVRRAVSAAKDLPDDAFYETYRMPRDLVTKLHDMISHNYEAVGSNNGKSLTSMEKLLIFLVHVGGNIDAVYGRLTHNTHKSTCRRAVKDTINAIHKTLVKELNYIRLPTEQEARHEARLFSQKSGFPEIAWCAIDGTHIKVYHFL